MKSSKLDIAMNLAQKIKAGTFGLYEGAVFFAKAVSTTIVEANTWINFCIETFSKSTETDTFQLAKNLVNCEFPYSRDKAVIVLRHLTGLSEVGASAEIDGAIMHKEVEGVQEGDDLHNILSIKRTLYMLKEGGDWHFAFLDKKACELLFELLLVELDKLESRSPNT